MAKPTPQKSLEKAIQIKSTIVPVEHKPLRCPERSELPSTSEDSESASSSDEKQPTTAVKTEAFVPVANVHQRAKFRERTIRELTGEPALPIQKPRTKAETVKQPAAKKTPPPIAEKPVAEKPIAENTIAESAIVEKPVANPAGSATRFATTPIYRPDAEAIKRMIKNHLQQYRPSAWEDDVSKNTLDGQPFRNIVSPADLPLEAFYASEDLVLYADQHIGRERLIDMIAADQLPIPSAVDREGYSRGYDGVYWMSGLIDYLKVLEVVRKYNVDVRRVLDFGCATGRSLRHFAIQSDCEMVWGTDINARHIRWLQETMPSHVKPVFNHAMPSLPIADASVDVVTAFSVFTHIDTFETCWLAELNRILADGGLCYLTVHNEDTWRVLRDEVANPNNRLVQSILKIDPEFGETLNQPMPDNRSVYRFTDFGPYRAQVFHSNNYLHRVWGRFFQIREIIPCHHVRQSVVVLQKNS